MEHEQWYEKQEQCCEEEAKWGRYIDSALHMAQNHGCDFRGMPAWKFCPWCGKDKT